MASRWMDRFGNVFMLSLQCTIIVNCAGAIMMGSQSSALLSNHSSSSVSANHAISWFASATIEGFVTYQPCDSNQQLRITNFHLDHCLKIAHCLWSQMLSDYIFAIRASANISANLRAHAPHEPTNEWQDNVQIISHSREMWFLVLEHQTR